MTAWKNLSPEQKARRNELAKARGKTPEQNARHNAKAKERKIVERYLHPEEYKKAQKRRNRVRYEAKKRRIAALAPDAREAYRAKENKRHAETIMRMPDEKRRAVNRARDKKRRAFSEFIAVDGEGLTREDNQHDYVLLAASDHTSVERWERDGLSTAECIEYLIDIHKRSPRGTLVAFAFGYDVNMILRDVSRDRLERINDGEYTTFDAHGQSSRDARYIMRFVPGKSVYVGRGTYTDGRWKTESGVTIWDAWGFFQSSFVRALEQWKIAPAETIDIIHRMKQKRGEFDDDMRGLIVGYCFRECELLVKLMTEFKRVSDAAGIHLRRWDGAGACAAALLNAHKMKLHVQPSVPHPESVETASLQAYFGGRIEIFGSGLISEPCYEYDINSAYPTELCDVPSMDGGTWHHLTRVPDWSRPHALYRVSWDVQTQTQSLGPFPWRRNDGSVTYPLTGEGWYHAVEALAAYTVYGDAIRIIDGYTYTPVDDTSPFTWVRDMYAQRRAYKETGDARHIVLKLALNSMYGKLAQSVSFDPSKRPPFQSYYLAGRVTAGTRARILLALHKAGNDAISAMTDAIFTRKPLGFVESDALGGWSKTSIPAGLLIMQPGVVLTPQKQCTECEGAGCSACEGGRNMAFGRSRGFHRASLDYRDAVAAWREHNIFASILVNERRFIGMGRALIARQQMAGWAITDDREQDMLGNLISEQWRRWVAVEKNIAVMANVQRKELHNGTTVHTDWMEWDAPKGVKEIGTPYTPHTAFRANAGIRQQDALEQPDYEESYTL